MLNDILATEIISHLAIARTLAVATFTTFNGKQIGCRIVRMWDAGDISSTAQIEVRVIGDQGCYPNGAKFVVDASVVKGAV